MNAAGSSEPAAIESVPANAPVSPGAAESLTPGELLRRERERRSISLLQAAEDLHLDTRVVEAIEANRFDLLGAPVYARGHLKKYAALMGLSPEFVIERYQAQANQPEEPTPVPASVTTGVAVGFERRASFKGPLLVSVSLIVLALGWWIVDEITTPSYEPRQVPSLEPVPDEPAVTGDQVTTTTTKLTPMPAPPAAQSVATSPAAPANVAPVRVRLEYSDASWTEIYDAAGKRLMFNLGEIGRVRTVSGTPPIRVTLGNASAVAVQVNERSVVVPRRAGRDSAKFVITADGEVQTMSDEVPVE